MQLGRGRRAAVAPEHGFLPGSEGASVRFRTQGWIWLINHRACRPPLGRIMIHLCSVGITVQPPGERWGEPLFS